METLSDRRKLSRGLKLALAATLVLAVLTAIAVVRAVHRSFDHICEVCVAFHGRTVCREAVGATREEARAIALDRACAFLTADRAEQAACVETPPASTDCPEN